MEAASRDTFATVRDHFLTRYVGRQEAPPRPAHTGRKRARPVVRRARRLGGPPDRRHRRAGHPRSPGRADRPRRRDHGKPVARLSTPAVQVVKVPPHHRHRPSADVDKPAPRQAPRPRAKHRRTGCRFGTPPICHKRIMATCTVASRKLLTLTGQRCERSPACAGPRFSRITRSPPTARDTRHPDLYRAGTAPRTDQELTAVMWCCCRRPPSPSSRPAALEQWPQGHQARVRVATSGAAKGPASRLQWSKARLDSPRRPGEPRRLHDLRRASGHALRR